jgi:hypothetical protein
MAWTKGQRGAEIELQRKLGTFVDREVYYYQFGIVEKLRAVGTIEDEDITNLYHYVVELSDGEQYLTEEQHANKVQELEANLEAGQAFDPLHLKQWQLDLETLANAEPEPQEIYEWWLVSNWLARKLEAKGEPILEAYGCVWWGRCMTGQSMMKDDVIREIYKEAKA